MAGNCEKALMKLRFDNMRFISSGTAILLATLLGLFCASAFGLESGNETEKRTQLEEVTTCSVIEKKAKTGRRNTISDQPSICRAEICLAKRLALPNQPFAEYAGRNGFGGPLKA